MGEVKRLRQENLRLKDQIQALSKEVEQMKLFASTEFHAISGWTPNWRERYSESWRCEKSLSFLFSDNRDELILFKTKAMAELERLGKKIEKVKNITKAIESMENYWQLPI